MFKYYDVENGFACLNRDQSDRRCDDYELRLCCPPEEGLIRYLFDHIKLNPNFILVAETTTAEVTTEPSLECDWTRWFDRDNPGGKGDWETPLSALGQGTCENPLQVEARR